MMQNFDLWQPDSLLVTGVGQEFTGTL